MWNYMSGDYKNVCLHETCWTGLELDKGDILLNFEYGFEVCSTHMLNSTGTAKTTTASQIRLQNATFFDGYMSTPSSLTLKTMNYAEFMSLMEFHIGVEVSSLRIKNIENDKIFTIIGRLPPDLIEYVPQRIIISFRCNDFIFCWNEYSHDTTWFKHQPESDYWDEL